MAMELAIEQLPLPDRIKVLADSVRLARAQKEGAAREEANWLDQLARAESQTGGTDIPLSGLIESNPYMIDAPPTKPADTQGDVVDPTTGESSGGA